MRKKIAIVFNRMIVGGVEKALLNFLRAIDTERYDVTLFTFNDKSPHYDELPADITVRFTACDHSKAQFWNDIKHLRIKGIANGGFIPMPSEETIATFNSVMDMVDAGWVLD